MEDVYLKKLDKAREFLRRETVICFSMDVDWASEYAIEQSTGLFQEYDLPVTVFVTHKSAAIDRLRESGKIRCGIHPNFMLNSSQ